MPDKKMRKKKTLSAQFTDHVIWLEKKMVALNKERVYEAAIDEDCSADAVNDCYLTAKEALGVVANYVFNIEQNDTPPANPVKIDD